MNSSFGNIGSSAFGWETLYGAYRWDGETGFYQVRNRYLHPKVGVWLSRDPIQYEGGVNLYEYVGNNIANFVDPLGMIKYALASCDVKEDLGDGNCQWECSCPKGYTRGFARYTFNAPCCPAPQLWCFKPEASDYLAVILAILLYFLSRGRIKLPILPPVPAIA